MINLLNILMGNEIKMEATIATSIRLPTIVFNDGPNESFSLENTSYFLLPGDTSMLNIVLIYL